MKEPTAELKKYGEGVLRTIARGKKKKHVTRMQKVSKIRRRVVHSS